MSTIEIDLTGYQDRTGPPVKLYRFHNCNRHHRSYRTLAKCVWRRAAWISGDGPYALVAYCGETTVTLWSSAEAARTGHEDGGGWCMGKEFIDRYKCGHACIRHHIIVRLADPAYAVRWDR